MSEMTLDRLIEATDRIEDLTQWKSIETAPKDGTEIIVGFDLATVWIVRSAWYRRVEDNPFEFDESDVGWWSYKSSVTQEKLDGVYEPTHWLCVVPGH